MVRQSQIQEQSTRVFTRWPGRSQAREAGLLRDDNGFPDRAHRVAACGNAVTPVIPELIGRAILAALQDSRTARPSRACAAGEAFDPRVSPTYSAGDA
jgi:hypothetical protein